MFSIQSNVMAMTAHRFAGGHENAMTKALGRLSSGLKINSAADDPSGMARMQKIRAQLAQIDATQENMMDELSKVEVADGVLSGIQDMMQRMNELATRSANGTMDDFDRANLDAEYQELIKEINRSRKATYNEKSLFENGGGIVDKTVGMRDMATSNDFDEIVITGGNLNAYVDELNKYLNDISNASKAGDTQKLTELGVDTSLNLSDKEKLQKAVIDFTKNNAERLLNSGEALGDYSITVGNGNVKIAGTAVAKGAYGLEGTSISTREGAEKAMETLKGAMQSVSKARAGYGATMNGISHALDNLSSMQNNLSESLSRIGDADMAKEMMNYTKSQILLQVAQAMMAQANSGSKDTAAFIKSMIGS